MTYAAIAVLYVLGGLTMAMVVADQWIDLSTPRAFAGIILWPFAVVYAFVRAALG